MDAGLDLSGSSGAEQPQVAQARRLVASSADLPPAAAADALEQAAGLLAAALDTPASGGPAAPGPSPAQPRPPGRG